MAIDDGGLFGQTAGEAGEALESHISTVLITDSTVSPAVHPSPNHYQASQQ
jgi:hypothetical protein